MGKEYRGVRLEDLRIWTIEWTDERAEHIRTRSERYGPGEFDVEPEWATEAALDVSRVVDLPGGGSESIEVIGYSTSAEELIKVWIHPKNLEEGVWFGASACKANSTDERNYREAEE